MNFSVFNPNNEKLLVLVPYRVVMMHTSMRSQLGGDEKFHNYPKKSAPEFQISARSATAKINLKSGDKSHTSIYFLFAIYDTVWVS